MKFMRTNQPAARPELPADIPFSLRKIGSPGNEPERSLGRPRCFENEKNGHFAFA
jgi:hypothetical protein